MDGAWPKVLSPAIFSAFATCTHDASKAKVGSWQLMVLIALVLVEMLLVLVEMFVAFVLMRVESDVNDPLKSTPDNDTTGAVSVPPTVTLPESVDAPETACSLIRV
jgi:hypothetical protein